MDGAVGVTEQPNAQHERAAIDRVDAADLQGVAQRDAVGGDAGQVERAADHRAAGSVAAGEAVAHRRLGMAGDEGGTRARPAISAAPRERRRAGRNNGRGVRVGDDDLIRCHGGRRERQQADRGSADARDGCPGHGVRLLAKRRCRHERSGNGWLMAASRGPRGVHEGAAACAVICTFRAPSCIAGLNDALLVWRCWRVVSHGWGRHLATGGCLPA